MLDDNKDKKPSVPVTNQTEKKPQDSITNKPVE